MLGAIEAWRIGSTTARAHPPVPAARPARRGPCAADVSSLRLVFQTGAACPVDVKRAMIEWWGPVFLEAYGATEVGVTTAITSEDWLDPPRLGRPLGRRRTPPWWSTRTGAERAARRRGPPVLPGRHRARASSTRATPSAPPPPTSSPGVFTLGEIGRVDDDGWVFITDRFADMVVTGGVNVYPAEMEQVLVAHPGVADVAGIGLPHPDLGEQLVALVVPADPAAPPVRRRAPGLVRGAPLPLQVPARRSASSTTWTATPWASSTSEPSAPRQS